MKARSCPIVFFSFIFTVLSLRVSSQPIEISASDPDYNIGSTELHKIIGHDSAYFYVLKFHNNQYHLEKLDHHLNRVDKKPIRLHEGLKSYNFETIVHFHHELYLFVSRLRFSDALLYYQKIDKNTLLPASDLTEIAKINFINGNWPDFYFALSKRETKLMLACRIKLNWSKVQFNEFYVFGENMELLWKRKDSFKFEGAGPRENQYIVDELGNISVLSLLKRESILSLFSDQRNVYTIYRYTSQGTVFNEYPITLGEQYIRGIRIVAGNQGELICAGLYSDLFRKGMQGTFFFKIHPDDERLYDSYVTKFDDAFMSRLSEIDEPTMGKEEEIMQYVITDLVLRADNKVMLIAEQFFNQSYDTYNNIIIACYNTDGQVYWNQVIEKSQDYRFTTASYSQFDPMGVTVHKGMVVDDIRRNQNNTFSQQQFELSQYREHIIKTGALYPAMENYCSYALMAPLDKTGIVLFYNDDIRNKDKQRPDKNFNRPRKSYLLAVTVDEFGNINRQPVLIRKKKGLFPVPIRYYDTLSECIIIPSFKGNKYAYLKLSARL